VKRWEDIPCKQSPKESRSGIYTYQTRCILMTSSIQEEDITIINIYTRIVSYPKRESKNRLERGNRGLYDIW